MSEMVQEFWGAIAFGAIAWILLWIARKRGFFRFPHPEVAKVPLTLYHLLAAFAIYFGVALLLSRPIISLLRKISYESPTHINAIGLSSWLNLIISLLIALILAIYWKTVDPKIAKNIWRRECVHGSYLDDIKMGALAWVLSFPLVLSVSQLLDVIVYSLFQVTQLPDQVAVFFLKMTFAHPLYFFLAVVSIIGLAPFIEELIFRGFLQTYARKFMGPKSAIFISSICFSFFHFTPEQGLGNIPIIGSLFVLALFLGFLYERQGSLLASMTLHASFNAISVLNLYALGGAPRGAL